jgi:succinoglycan biosynthesis protein ExoH
VPTGSGAGQQQESWQTTMIDSFTTSPRTSSAITIMRPLLILFVTLAHIPGIDSVGIIERSENLNFDDWFGVLLKGVIAKGGVPLLSLFSGYLAIYSLEKYGYFKLLLRKAKRLIWPLFWSNLLLILLIIYPTQAIDPGYRSDLQIYPFNWLGWIQATFAYYRIPANPPLYFLKDLYTCFLLIPLLFLLVKIRYLNVLLIFWMAWKCIYLKTAFIFPVFPIWFFRFDIVFAFYLGMLLFHWHRNLLLDHRAINYGLLAIYVAVCGVTSAVYVVVSKADHEILFLWLDFSVKVFSVLGCVAIMSILSARKSRLSDGFTWLSPYSYPLFLTHVFTFIFFERLYLKIFDHPVFFGISGSLFTVTLLLTAIVVAILLDRIWFGLIAPLIPVRGR